MHDELILGVDVGTTNVKAVVFDLRGRSVGAQSLPTPTRRPRPGWAEYEPEALWQAAAAAIRGALRGLDAARVVGVAVASMGESAVPLDAAGKPTYAAIAWFDTRTLPQYRWWREVVGDEVIFQITGANPIPIFGVNKLMWLRDNEPDAYARAVVWLNIADYIAYRLSGAQATDYSLATRTMALDVAGRRWSLPLIERAGLRPELFAPLVASGTRVGGVTPEAAGATGLVAGTSVGAGGHDHVCGALAAGVSEPGACLDSTGTAEVAFVPLDAARLDDVVRLGSFNQGAHVARDRYYIMNGLWTSGACVEWGSRLFDCPGAGDAFARMEAAAAQAPLGSLGVLFVPRLAAGDRGGFVGLTADADAGIMARAIYEGLAYEWRRSFEQIVGPLELPIDTIRVIGGGARSDLWMQVKADVMGRELRVLDVDESVALGAALLGGLAAGAYPDERAAQAAMAYGARTIAPDPARAAHYDAWYQGAYLRAAAALRDLGKAIEAAAAR